METGKTEQTGATTTEFIDLFGLGSVDFNKKSSDVEEVEEVVTTNDGVEKVEELDEEAQEKTEVVKPVETAAAEAVDEGGEGIENIITSLSEVFDFDDEKEVEPTLEGLKNLITEAKVAAKQQGISEYKESLGERGKVLATILETGGTVEDFLNIDNGINFEEIPLTTSTGEPILKNQRNLVEDWMKTQDADDEEIQERLSDLESAGLLEKEAKLAQKKLVVWQKRKEETILQTKQQEAEQVKLQKETEAAEFKKKVLSTNEIAGFKLDKGQSEKLYDYITKADKQGKTQFQKEDTEENRLLYAYFAMTGFDKEKLSREITTKKTIKLKQALSNYTDGNTSAKGSQSMRRATEETLNIPWVI